MIQKLRLAMRAFLNSWKGQSENVPPVVAPEKSPGYALAVEDLANMMNDTGLNMALMEASMQAKYHQDKQIDDYFKEVMSRYLSPDMLELYWKDQSKIPTAMTQVEIITDFAQGTSGRHVKFFFRDQLIGDAKFMTKFQNGEMTMYVEKIIK